MRFCGLKTTHDGGVALVDDSRLVFSYEMEKLDNRGRYAKIDDLAMVFALLADYGYEPEDVDHFVLDGWHKTHKVRNWHGQEVILELGPYRRGLLGEDLFQEYRSSALDLPYLSYSHYAGHVASAYCTSPFAGRNESSFVLSWDGLMFPFLYFLDVETGRAHGLGSLIPLIGDAYTVLSQNFPPFDRPIEFPFNLGLAGKIMAYVCQGTPNTDALRYLETRYRNAARDAMAAHRHPGDRFLQRDTGADILKRMNAGLRMEGVDDADMLASIHQFVEEKLVRSLTEAVRASAIPNRNLCFVGGCALNIKWNRAIRESGAFDDVWVPPFPNDSGSAIGAACCAMLARTERRALDWDVYAGPPLGTPALVEGWEVEECDVDRLAKILHEDNEPVLFLNGRAEMGPRALGNRSILAPAVDAGMKDVLNRIKDREWYRPVAPICLEHRAPDLFTPGSPDPYMLFDHDVNPEWASRIPAVCHLDGTARIQTVNERQNPDAFQLLSAYERLSGIPVLCNTSANWKDKGFFPDVQSGMRWGRTNHVWSEGRLYSRSG